LLVFLVALSLFLTYQLWYGRMTAAVIDEKLDEPVYFEKPRPLAEIITPQRIFVHRKEELYHLREGDRDFHLVWDSVSAAMQGEGSGSALTGTPPEDSRVLLTVQFSPVLPVGPGTPWLIDSRFRVLEQIELRHLEDKAWIVAREPGKGEAEAFLFPPDQAALLYELCNSVSPAGRAPYLRLSPGELQLGPGLKVSITEGIYVPGVPVQLAELALKQERLDQELLLNTFFVNRSLVRVIEERDRSLIYTDGEKGLRLSRGLDYWHPQLAQEPATLTYVSALNTVSRLIGYYGGWPETLRLESIALVKKNVPPQEIYCTQWRSYFSGYPLLGKAHATMFFNDGGLVEYQRNLCEPLYFAGSPFTTAHYLEALQAAAVYLHTEKGTENLVLEEMGLAFRVNDSVFQLRGVPVWAIRLSGTLLLLKASDLTLLEEIAP
jgi:hypothetical protein